MGVSAFFRWLSKKYPSIVVHCVEEKPKDVNGVQMPVDTSQPNPNGIEFDNLYLDMNGIIHPCCHPEDKPEPKNEDEMMTLIFQYIDRIFSVVRPRQLLYMAIDGVAPRAKMNLQRARRFRASKESLRVSSNEKAKMMSELREELESKGCCLPPAKPATERFDRNCITPGTPFMFRLANCLRYYIHDRLNNDPGWRGIKVILSDASVPGEGEHKIMDYIRRQRAQPNHDPNTRHCLCGTDADLIMLGLATHEVNFTIIREGSKLYQPKPCDMCGQMGHEMKNCEGLPKEMQGMHDEVTKPVGQECKFIFLRLNVLREYLERELKMDNLPFKYEFERALDDWVFLCFFAGNDFLPHLPSLENREDAIDRLVKLYKNAVYKTGGYLTDSGVVALERVQLVLTELGHAEDEIFKKRRDDDLNFKKRMKARKERERSQHNYMRPGGLLGAAPIGQGPSHSGGSLHYQAYEMRKQNMAFSAQIQLATGKLKQLMNQTGTKNDEDSDEEPPDDVRLWEDGWKNRYYSQKFGVGENDFAFRYAVANHYAQGLCWVLRYYYQGCASWKWYFPYHYAPFASDFVNIGDLPNDFEKNTRPLRPMEQLMSVLPAASKKHLPPTWQKLMYEPSSPIIDFYPINFKIDPNGKKYTWQRVALLPFVDEARLHKTLKSVYPDLTEAERKRNALGADKLFLGSSHPAYSFFKSLYEGSGPTRRDEVIQIETEYTQGMAGTVWCDPCCVETGGVVMFPSDALDLTNNQTICVQYRNPTYDVNFLFRASVLPGAKFPERTLQPEGFDQNFPNMPHRHQLGYQSGSGYRQNSDVSTASCMIRNTTGMQGQGYVLSSQSMVPSCVPNRSMGGGGQQYGGREERNWNNSSNNIAWQRNMARQQQQQNVHRPLPGTSSYDSYQSRGYSGGGGGGGYGGGGGGRYGGGGSGGYGGGDSYDDRGRYGGGGPDRNRGAGRGGRPPLSGGYGDGYTDRRYQGNDSYQRYDDRRQQQQPSRGRYQEEEHYWYY